jgi:hypothetical protein
MRLADILFSLPAESGVRDFVHHIGRGEIGTGLYGPDGVAYSSSKIYAALSSIEMLRLLSLIPRDMVPRWYLYAN